MCYFLYGAVNGGLHIGDYDKVMRDSEYHFNTGNIKEVNACVENCNDDYRITLNHCDCNTVIGKNNPNKKGLEEFKDLLLNLKSVRRIKYVLLSKNWRKQTNTKQEVIHINDIDILQFLANIEDNCLYKIELYPKYY